MKPDDSPIYEEHQVVRFGRFWSWVFGLVSGVVLFTALWTLGFVFVLLKNELMR